MTDAIRPAASPPDPRVRVLQAMAGAEVGGAEAFFVRLSKALRAADVEQRVVIRRHLDRAGVLRRTGVPTREVAFGGAFDFSTRRHFADEIAAFKPDVVLTWMNRATRFCPRSTRRHRFVHAARVGGYYNLKYYRRCHHLIANTKGIADYLRARGWPGERVHHLPNFVSAERKPAAFRSDYHTPDDAPLLLAIGRLHRNKAFDVLLAALAELPDCTLWLAGSGPEEAALKACAREYGVEARVRFLGWRDDVAALFAAADVFVCPSRHEPLGNVVVEAWAQAVPVVAAASAGPMELIEDETSGLLVPIDDAGALAAGIRRVLGDDDMRGQLTAAGAAAFDVGFTEAAIVERYRGFFDAIVRGTA